MSAVALLKQFSAKECTLTAGTKGELELTFARDAQGVRMTRRAHTGPLLLQKPLYPEGSDVCHVCVLHGSEALTGKDSLYLSVKAEPDANVLLTTPHAVAVRRNAGFVSSVRRDFFVYGGAALEWLPQEQIVFDGAHCRTNSHVVLENGSKFIGWEIAGLGLSASNNHFSSGSYGLQLNIWHQDRPLLLETTRFDADDPMLSMPWGMGGHTVLGTMAAFPGSRFLLETLRTLQKERTETLFAPTLIDGLLVCRCLAKDARQVKELFRCAWERIRPQIMGRTAFRPRAWNN